MLLASLMLVLSVFLAACGGGEDDANGNKDDGKDNGKDSADAGGDDNKAELDFPLETSNDAEPWKMGK